MLIGALQFVKNGLHLFSKYDKGAHNDDDDHWKTGMVEHPQFERYMTAHRFKTFRRFFPIVNVDKTLESTGPWAPSYWRNSLVQQNSSRETSWEPLDSD